MCRGSALLGEFLGNASLEEGLNSNVFFRGLRMTFRVENPTGNFLSNKINGKNDEARLIKNEFTK